MPERPPFVDQLRAKWDEGKFVCVGLDADITKLPPHLVHPTEDHRQWAQEQFLKPIVDATADLVCAFKPNIGFFEDHVGGEAALEEIVRYIHHNFPGIPVIGDVKRGDIGNTNTAYARAMFGRYDFDAITLNSQYFGGDTLKPFQADEYKNRGLILMAKTSNPGSAELQDMPIHLDYALHYGLVTEDEAAQIRFGTDGKNPRVYEMVAFLASHRWNKHKNLGLVVGATHVEAFKSVRRLAGDVPFLIPGIGNQEGDLEKTLQLAPDSKDQGMIINSAGGIIFASNGRDFAEAARAKTLTLHNQITELRAA